jgi:hypothetical protein
MHASGNSANMLAAMPLTYLRNSTKLKQPVDGKGHRGTPTLCPRRLHDEPSTSNQPDRGQGRVRNRTWAKVEVRARRSDKPRSGRIKGWGLYDYGHLGGGADANEPERQGARRV